MQRLVRCALGRGYGQRCHQFFFVVGLCCRKEGSGLCIVGRQIGGGYSLEIYPVQEGVVAYSKR